MERTWHEMGLKICMCEETDFQEVVFLIKSFTRMSFVLTFKCQMCGEKSSSWDIAVRV